MGETKASEAHRSLDQNPLVLWGGRDEAPGALLKGTLVLCLADSLKVQSLRLRFTGEKRVSWRQASGTQKKDEVFLRNVWEFVHLGTKRSDTLSAGNYEFPFDYVIPGNYPESIEGLADWIVYRMKATIDRGLLAQNVLARKHLRIVRTLATTAEELFSDMAIENIWEGKVNYTLSTPSKGVVFGTAILANFKLASQLKGLTIGQVETRVCENQKTTFESKKGIKKPPVTRIVAEDQFEYPQDQATQCVDGQDSWIFSRSLSLPRSLKQCLQTVDALGIRVSHKLVFKVKLINPDGHVSALHATLPIHIFLSPTLPLNEDQNTIMPGPGIADPRAFAIGAPPIYGEHQLDRLFGELDTAGYMTPPGNASRNASGAGTPFNSRSRTGSINNLASLNAMTSDSAAATLQTRLHNLGDGSNRHADRQSSDETSPDQTPEDTQDLSSGPQHFEYSPEEMSRVPSYSTALRTLPPITSNAGLPNYELA
ncbi:MAG: hypothetical protein Q9174_002094 [Haloplaca sp. 1 TL-2023]